MYITPRQRQRNITTTIIIALAIPFTVLAAYFITQYFIGASGETTPENVLVSNVTSNSLTLSWSTTAETTGSVTVKKGGSNSAPYLDSRGNSRRKTHYVEVTDLEPNVEYSFTIISNTTKYTDEKGSPFKFKTTPITGETPIPSPIFGSVTGAEGNDYVVYVIVDGSTTVYPASGSINTGGNWIIDLSGLRDGTNNLVKVEKDTKLVIVVRGKDGTGAKLSGTYNDLFDADGKLRGSAVLSIAPLSSFTNLFPSKSVITRVVAQVTPTPTPTPTTPVKRQFRVIQDVKWTPITGTQVGGVTTPTVTTGKSTVKITNVTDTAFTVVWLTSKQETGSIKYGTSADSQNTEVFDERDSILEKKKLYSHSVKVTKLQPEKKYFFVIYSGGVAINNSGASFEVTTYATLANPPDFKTVSGKVNSLAEDGVVYARIINKDSSGTVGNSTYTSAIIDDNGNWIATYGDLRNESGSEYYSHSDADVMEVELLVYQNSTKVSESMKNIDSKTITIDLSSGSGVREIIKVVRLTDYGVK
ncbi:fibronectin type III domain-containing protein [Candidatus Dojkabacteria bacterium]|nr:fibronectin type III domain-containing protein [Candidatus Dojkabacteria bacterium]